MIITSPGYMQTRSLEVGLGLTMLASGFVFILPGETLGAPIFAVLKRWTGHISEAELGSVLMISAVVRWAALAINSHHCSTPLVRAAGCLLGAFLWVSAATGIAKALPAAPAIPWVLALTIVLGALEMYSGFRTGLDMDALDSLGFRRLAHRRRREKRAERASA